MGANVCGYGLPPDTEPSYFDVCALGARIRSIIGDVRDEAALSSTIGDIHPEVVFHLAAQPLVRRSYREPTLTFATNVIGTTNLLEAVRKTTSVRAVVVVTSDKCYENGELVWGYREADRLGGQDPYSASKACAEIVCSAYRRSFFESGERQVTLATARAGNVIGGGDWSEDRIIPDAVRAFSCGNPLVVRNPKAVRPWQHVLEPLAGYLMLAERLHRDGVKYAGAWNFGPAHEDAIAVSALADLLVRQWGAGAQWRDLDSNHGPYESLYLKLDCGKAHAQLAWRPRLRLQEAVEMTVGWYREAMVCRRGRMYEISRNQILQYESQLER
jgi:CDP-glucose 4,6-dehydratase